MSDNIPSYIPNECEDNSGTDKPATVKYLRGLHDFYWKVQGELIRERCDYILTQLKKTTIAAIAISSIITVGSVCQFLRTDALQLY